MFILILTIFVCLVKVYFSILFYKFIVFKVKFGITFCYIVVYKKILERLISSRILFSELLLSLMLYK